MTYVASREAFDSVETREIKWILDEWKCRVIIRCEIAAVAPCLLKMQMKSVDQYIYRMYHTNDTY